MTCLGTRPNLTLHIKRKLQIGEMFRIRVSLNHHNFSVIRKTIAFLVMVAIFTCENISRGAAAGSLKYSHGPLVTALSGHSVHEYGTPANSGNGVGPIEHIVDPVGVGGGGSDSVSVNSASSLGGGGGQTVSGGEILVPKSFPMSPQEPTCEQLRAMWIFSKRQSRAAEITNEIPTYRDPFAYNVWEPYYSTTRSLGAVRVVPRYGERSHSPVFGRVVSREPILSPRIPGIGGMGQHQRQRHLGNIDGRIFGAETRAITMSGNGGMPRRPSQYRFVGTNGSPGAVAATPLNVVGGPNSVAAVQGSFQKLKELIWTERAKELTQQRHAEELAARAAVLNEIANGQNVQTLSYKNPFKSESPLMDENRSPDSDSYLHNNDAGRSMYIASGQTQSNNHNKNGVNGKSSSHSYSHKAHGQGMHKSSIFTGNQVAASNSGGAGRLLLPSMFASSYPIDNFSTSGSTFSTPSRERGNSGRSISKTYPMRPSHFRERNRSLFKQTPVADHFQRNIRQQPHRADNMLEYEPDDDERLRTLKIILRTLNRRNMMQKSRMLSSSGHSFAMASMPYDDSGESDNEPTLLGVVHDDYDELVNCADNGACDVATNMNYDDPPNQASIHDPNAQFAKESLTYNYKYI